MSDDGVRPRIAGKQPLEVKLEAGKRYWWCSCGRSAKQPFCDGSHKGTGFKPVKIEAEEDKSVWLCVCKQTKNPPYCDGSHKAL